MLCLMYHRGYITQPSNLSGQKDYFGLGRAFTNQLGKVDSVELWKSPPWKREKRTRRASKTGFRSDTPQLSNRLTMRLLWRLWMELLSVGTQVRRRSTGTRKPKPLVSPLPFLSPLSYRTRNARFFKH